MVHHRAAIHEHERVAHFAELGEDVRADEDGFAALAEDANEVLEFQPRLRIEARGGLVEDKKLRIVQQRAREAEPLRLAFGEPVHRSAGERNEIGELGHLGDALRKRGAAETVGAREEIEVVADRGVLVSGEMIGHPADAATHFVGILGDVDAADLHGAMIRQIERREDAHRGRLARAVGPDEADHLAGQQRKRHAVDRAHAAEPAHEILHFEHGSDAHWPPFSPATTDATAVGVEAAGASAVFRPSPLRSTTPA